MKVDIRKIVTDKIIEGLEKGKIPWQKPWSEGMACNHVTRKAYRGLNQLILSFVAEDKGWINRWITFKAINENGWTIKKGESPQYIAFYKWIEKEDGDGKIETFPMLRYYKVWSISQLVECEKIEVPEEKEFIPLEKAETIISEMPNPPAFSFGGDKAAYYPVKDKITMPLKEFFVSPDSYYSTIFHEMAHSTGHEKRLNRIGIANYDRFGSEKYSIEELIAELTASFLCAESKIDSTISNSTAYIASWLTVLKDNRQMILTASAEAQKASDYILGITWD